MGSSSELGLGLILERLPTHAKIAEITDLGDVGITRPEIDVTNHDSSGNAEEFIAGLIQGGEFTVNCNLIAGDTSGQIAAIASCLAGTTGSYIIRHANSTHSTYQFYGYVKSYRIKSETKGTIKATLTFKVARAAPAFTATGV